MSTADVLQDFNYKPRINKVALFIVHVGGIICFGFAGQFLSLVLFTRSFDSFQYQVQHPPAEDAAIIDDMSLLPLVNKVLSISLVIIGGIISYIQCRKRNVKPIIPISILLYGFLLWWAISSEGVMTYIGRLFPGVFFLLVMHMNIGQLVNFVFFFCIALFLFLSKPAKKWWHKQPHSHAV